MTFIRIIREPLNGDHTPGVAFVNGLYFAWSCEDPVREVPGMPVHAWKVKGLTAIPAGTYPIVLAMSPKRKIVVPWLLEVPGFSSIQIHPLNRASESEGCIGLGYKRTTEGIQQSRPACVALTEIIRSRGGDARITIENARVV